MIIETAFKAFYARLRSAGICPDGSEEVRLRKVVPLFACGLMIAAAALWLAIYQALGLPVSAPWPVAFQLGSLATLAYYLVTLKFGVFRAIQHCAAIADLSLAMQTLRSASIR